MRFFERSEVRKDMSDVRNKSRKRDKGKLHRTTIRIREDVFKDIMDYCDKQNITMNEYINTFLENKEEVTMRARIKELRGRLYEIQMSDDVKSRMDTLTKRLNENTNQIRRIGVNLSSLIRDIRNGKISQYTADQVIGRQDGKSYTLSEYLNKVYEIHDEVMSRQLDVANALFSMLYEAPEKVEKVERIVIEVPIDYEKEFADDDVDGDADVYGD